MESVWQTAYSGLINLFFGTGAFVLGTKAPVDIYRNKEGV